MTVTLPSLLAVNDSTPLTRVRTDRFIGFDDVVGKQFALVFASLRIGNAAGLRKIVKKL
nr:hypothetical protein [Bifidobacterium catenulatum]